MSKRSTVSIFDYLHTSEYLRAVFLEIKAERPRYSIRAWAKLLNANSPTTLARVLSNERQVPKDMLPRISKVLFLDPSEKAYLELMVLAEKGLSAESFLLLREGLIKFKATMILSAK